MKKKKAKSVLNRYTLDSISESSNRWTLTDHEGNRIAVVFRADVAQMLLNILNRKKK